MRKAGRPAAEVFEDLRRYRTKDAPWIRVLNSICTMPHPLAVEASKLVMDVNMGDPRIFRGCQALERDVLRMFGSFLGKPDCAGSLTSGGTEANLLAMYVARRRRPDIARPEIVVGETVHYSFDKVCDMLGIGKRVAGLDSRFRMDLRAAAELIGPNTISLVGTAGSSEFGAVDPIEDLAQLAAAAGVHFHVDAATGGFIIPFARTLGRPLPQFDFTVGGVDSITIDPHKYGLATIPAGGVFFRNRGLLEQISLESFFTATPTHRSFVGTRPAAAAACYALFEGLGYEGYLRITERNYAMTRHFAEQLARRGYSLALEPELNILVVRVADAAALSLALERKGWIVSVSKRFCDCLRLVVTHHVDEDMITQFLDCLDAEIQADRAAGRVVNLVCSDKNPQDALIFKDR